MKLNRMIVIAVVGLAARTCSGQGVVSAVWIPDTVTTGTVSAIWGGGATVWHTTSPNNYWDVTLTFTPGSPTPLGNDVAWTLKHIVDPHLPGDVQPSKTTASGAWLAANAHQFHDSNTHPTVGHRDDWTISISAPDAVTGLRDIQVTGVHVPEPSSAALLCAGIAALAWRVRKGS